VCTIQANLKNEPIIWLDNARITASFAVIVLHASAAVVIDSEFGSIYWWYGNFYDSMVRWCVPVFVMISGALLLDPKNNESLTVFYSKRLSKVLFPIVFWSSFYLMWTVVKSNLYGGMPSGKAILYSILSGKPYYHLWYLYMILGLYVFIPFFRKIIAESTYRELIVVTCFMFAIAGINTLATGLQFSSRPSLFTDLFIQYIPYLFMGHIIRNTVIKPSRILVNLILSLSIMATMLGIFVLGSIKGLKIGLYFYNYLSITVIAMSICIMNKFKNSTVPILGLNHTRQVAGLSFGVFLIHPIILDFLYLFGIGVLEFNPILAVPLVAAACFIISLLCAWIFRELPILKRTI